MRVSSTDQGKLHRAEMVRDQAGPAALADTPALHFQFLAFAPNSAPRHSMTAGKPLAMPGLTEKNPLTLDIEGGPKTGVRESLHLG